jgi:hypothetical protein
MAELRTILGFSAYVLFFAWLDWIIHRSIVFVIVVGGGLILAAAYRARIAAAITSAARGGSTEWAGSVVGPIVDRWRRLPVRVQRMLVSLTPLLYFLLRGQGTSEAGTAVVIAGALVAAASIFFGHVIDPPLQNVYAARDRLLAQ